MFKKMISVLFCFSFIFNVGFSESGRNIEGVYEGALDVQVATLRLIFHIEKDGNGYKASVDSIDQGVKGIPVTEVQVDGDNLKLILPSINAVFKGTFKDDLTVVGDWIQGGRAMPLTIKKTKKPSKISRFQEPKKPYPYNSKDITFVNKKDNIKLAGTITYPKKEGVFPAIILISGSGPQNRNEELLGHKPFLVLSDFFTKNNFVVLRYDDRGVSESEGNFAASDSFDFANDVEAAIDYLNSQKLVKVNKIGLMGHSEGGLIAPIVAARNSNVKFVIMLAGPVITGDKILVEQNKLILKSVGMDDEGIEKYAKQMELEINCVIKNSDLNEAKKDILIKSGEYFDKNFKDYKNGAKFGMVKENIEKRAATFATKWFKTFFTINPKDYLQKVNAPVLALFGEKDFQVPVSINENVAKKLLAKGNPKSKVVVAKSCNHLFQTCKTGNLAEYSKIDETISPKVLNIILKWTGDVIKE